MSRKSRVYTFNGETLTTRELSIKYNVPETLIWNSFNKPNFPDLQYIIDSRKELGINDINNHSFKPRENKKYEFRGEQLTANEISEKYKIPVILVYKCFTKKCLSLERMIKWREDHGICDINNSQYSDNSSTDILKYKIPSTKYKFDLQEKKNTGQPSTPENFPEQEISKNKINTLPPSLPENFIDKTKEEKKDIKVVLHNLYVGSIFGSYKIMARYKKGNTMFYTVYCSLCDMVFSDLPQRLLYLVPSHGCCCNLFSHFRVLRHLPSKLQKLSLCGEEKTIDFYSQYIGYTVGGLKIKSVSKKDTNDMSYYIFDACCEKCNRHFTMLAFYIITGTFKHKCIKNKKFIPYKNSTSIKGNKFLGGLYNKNTCKIHYDKSVEMMEMLNSHISFYSREAGTESFIELLIDCKINGVYDKFINIYGDYLS